MTRHFPSPTRWWCAGGLLAVAAGIVLQILAGVDFPVVPPGLVVTLIAAALVLLVGRRWVPALGLLIAVWLTVGFFLSGTAPRLLDPTPAGAFAGLWVQVLGIVATGVAAAIELARTRRGTGRTTGARP